MGQDNCKFCGSLIVIKSDHPRINPHNLNRSVISEHIAEFRTALRRDVNNAEAHYGLGVAYFNLGLLEESIEELQQATRLMPENPHIQTQLAVVFLDAHREGANGALQNAAKRIETALKIDPENLEANLFSC
jgi:superkiller protein 3